MAFGLGLGGGGVLVRTPLFSEPFEIVNSALDCGYSSAILVNGDSTGNATDEWVYLTATGIGALFPSSCILYQAWNDATQNYANWTTIQAGDGQRYLVFNPPTDTNCRYALVADVGDWTDDLQIEIDISADDWTPSATRTMLARFSTAGNRAFRIYLNSDGKIYFSVSSDGTAEITLATTAVTGFADGSRVRLRFSWDKDNGSGGYTQTIEKSTDGGQNWTSIGSTVNTSAGATAIHKPASVNYELGGRGQNGEIWAGKIYEVLIRDGLVGPVINPQPIENWQKYNSTNPAGQLGGASTLYVINGSQSGQGIAYFDNATRRPKLCRPFYPCLFIANTGHNETFSQTKSLLATWDTWHTNLKTALPGAAFAMITQNPRVSPDTLGDEEAKKVHQTAMWAHRNGWGVINTFRAFVKDGRALSGTLISDVDGVHPLTAGNELLRNTILRAFTERRSR